MDDLLFLPGSDALITVTPDVVRNAIVGADRRIDDFRLAQTAADRLELSLPSAPPAEAAEAARAALERQLAAIGATATIDVVTAPVLEVSVRKLRRVERRWQP